MVSTIYLVGAFILVLESLILCIEEREEKERG